MAIKFACPYCDKISSVPDSFGGKKGKCPSCKKVIEVPDPNAAAGPESGDDIEVVEESTDDQSVHRGGGDDGSKACPYCGETIKAVAKKCKYCGEFLEDKKKMRRKRGRSGPRPQNHLALAILATVFCCWPVGIFAIIQAASVDSKWNAGDFQGARLASERAKSLSFWSIGLIGALLVLYIGIAIIANL